MKDPPKPGALLRTPKAYAVLWSEPWPIPQNELGYLDLGTFVVFVGPEESMAKDGENLSCLLVRVLTPRSLGWMFLSALEACNA